MSYESAPPPPPPSAGGPGAPYGAAPAGRNGKALWSLISGIVGLLCCSPLGIVAIILGRQAQSEIEASGGAQEGAGMAKAGFIIGIIALVWMVISILLYATGALSFGN